MKQYRVVSPISLSPGTAVRLTKEQALRRQHQIEHVSGGHYLVKSAIGFKAGEVVGLDGEMPKALLVSLDPVEKGADAKAAKSAAAAKAESDRLAAEEAARIAAEQGGAGS